MHVLIKPELERFIAEKISAGEYADPSDIVNEALDALKEREVFSPEHEAYLRRETRRGLAQLDRGEYSQFNAESVIAEERQRMANGKGSA